MACLVRDDCSMPRQQCEHLLAKAGASIEGSLFVCVFQGFTTSASSATSPVAYDSVHCSFSQEQFDDKFSNSLGLV